MLPGSRSNRRQCLQPEFRLLYFEVCEGVRCQIMKCVNVL